MKAGDILDDRFALREKLAGSRGDTFRAEVVGEGMNVVVRVLDARVPEGSPRAEAVAKAARALCRLSHPNLAEVLDFGFAGDRPYLVTQEVAGLGLGEVIAGRAPMSSATRGLAEAKSAIEALHEEGFVHGELRAASVVIATGGRAVVIDHGVAHLEAIARARTMDRAEDLAAFRWIAEAWLAAEVRAARKTPSNASKPASVTDPKIAVQKRRRKADATPARGTPAFAREITGKVAAVPKRHSAPSIQVREQDIIQQRPVRRAPPPVIEGDDVLSASSISTYALNPAHAADARARTINLALTCAVALMALLAVLRLTI